MYIEDKKTGEALMRDVLEWAKKRNPLEEYIWIDADDCACGRYAHEKGVVQEWRNRMLSWGKLNNIAFPVRASLGGHPRGTMGEFASRLEKELA